MCWKLCCFSLPKCFLDTFDLPLWNGPPHWCNACRDVSSATLQGELPGRWKLRLHFPLLLLIILFSSRARPVSLKPQGHGKDENQRGLLEAGFLDSAVSR